MLTSSLVLLYFYIDIKFQFYYSSMNCLSQTSDVALTWNAFFPLQLNPLTQVTVKFLTFLKKYQLQGMIIQMKLKPFFNVLGFLPDTPQSLFLLEDGNKPGTKPSTVLIWSASTATFPLLCCIAHRAVSSSSNTRFSTGEMEKKLCRQKIPEASHSVC